MRSLLLAVVLLAACAPTSKGREDTSPELKSDACLRGWRMPPPFSDRNPEGRQSFDRRGECTAIANDRCFASILDACHCAGCEPQTCAVGSEAPFVECAVGGSDN